MTKDELLTGMYFIRIETSVEVGGTFKYLPPKPGDDHEYVCEVEETCTTCYPVIEITETYIRISTCILDKKIQVVLLLHEYTLIT